MRAGRANVQIGKQGLTSGIITSLENAFKMHTLVKIHVLKSAGHTKENVRMMADEIISKLGDKYILRIVGFTIFIKKRRKARK